MPKDDMAAALARQETVPLTRRFLFDPVQLEASLCRDSLADFVQRFWDVVVPETLHWNWHMEALCEDLQAAAEKVFREEPKEADRVYNVPPGSSKSTICSIMFPIWVWTRFPSARTICGSYAERLSLDLSRKSRNIVNSDKFRKLYPHIKLAEDQDTKSYFANTHGGMRYAVGTGGSITGFHAHFIIVDDPIDPTQAIQEAELQAANHWMTETISQRKVNKEVTVTILIMQRLHQNDPSAVMLKRREQGLAIRHVCFPAEVDGSGLDVVRPRRYAAMYVDGLLDPKRISRKVLREALISLGQYGYSGQMLQNPVPLGGGMFKTDKITVEKQAPRFVDFKRLIRYWDKAGTKKEDNARAAHTAGVLMGEDTHGRFWVLDVVRGQWESAERERIILQTARGDGQKVRIKIEQEPGSGGKDSARATMRMLKGFVVYAHRPTGDKTIRADTFSVQVNMGNVFMKRADWNTEYLSELRFFPNSTFKDQVDASSGAFGDLSGFKRRIGGGTSTSKVDRDRDDNNDELRAAVRKLTTRDAA